MGEGGGGGGDYEFEQEALKGHLVPVGRLLSAKPYTTCLTFSEDRHDLLAGVGAEGLSVWTIGAIEVAVTEREEEEGANDGGAKKNRRRSGFGSGGRSSENDGTAVLTLEPPISQVGV